mmetsp:Transcript_80707/g.254688  ORF Transcript_80707/g.254688 Transcript_80707/m.254688 type:complete len:288 (-) Transcript_80707:107-970(-)
MTSTRTGPRPGMPSAGQRSGRWAATSNILSTVRHNIGPPSDTLGGGNWCSRARACATAPNSGKSPLCMSASSNVRPSRRSMTNPRGLEWNTRGPTPASPASESTAPMASGLRRRKTRSVYRLMTSGWPCLSAAQTRFAKPTVIGSKPCAASSVSSREFTDSNRASHSESATALTSGMGDAPSEDGNPMETNHSATREHGNLESMLVFVGTMSPIFRNRTSEISSSASEVRPRLESLMARAMTVSTLGFGSGSGHLFNKSQHRSSCFWRSSGAMMPNRSAAKELDSMP